MAITPIPHPTPAGVVSAACAELDAVAGPLWSARGAGELVAGVQELQRLKAKAAALEAELLAELDVRGRRQAETWGGARRPTGSPIWPAPPGVRAARP